MIVLSAMRTVISPRHPAGPIEVAAVRLEQGRATARDLIGGLRKRSERFAARWDSGAVGNHESARKTIVHPEVGELELDCDVLTVAGSDLRLVAYTAVPGSAAEQRL